VLNQDLPRVTLPQRDWKIVIPNPLYDPKSSMLKQEHLIDPQVEWRPHDFDRNGQD
jgi:hypothetical protein